MCYLSFNIKKEPAEGFEPPSAENYSAVLLLNYTGKILQL